MTDTSGSATRGPLDGVRVVDLTSVVMGPLATRELGDLGADVITIEDRDGDTNRSIGPGPEPGLSGTALNLMRNKRSVGLDLKHPDGRAALLRIVAGADAFVTNLRPGPLRRLGLDEPSIREVRPDIVMCVAAGYPADGDQADAPAYDDVIQSASAIPDLFSRQGHDPTLVPTLIADKVCGMALANAVLAALYHRAATGEGQRIEIPMVDVMRAFVLVEHGAGAMAEPPVGQPGYGRILVHERRPQATSDGAIGMLPYTAEHYRAIFRAVDRHDLVDDPRIATRRSRFEHSGSLYCEVADIVATRTTDEWLEFCDTHGIPAARVATLDDLVAALPIVEHPTAGRYRQIPPPARFSGTPAGVRRHAPRHGEHGPEVLAEHGYGEDEIAELERIGVLFRS